MLEITEEAIHTHIKDARAFRKPFIEQRVKMIAKLAGPHYRSDCKDDPTPENYPFAYREFIKPQIVFGAPACDVTAIASRQDEPIADALDAMTNYWALETNWKDTLSSAVDDAFVGFGVTKVGIASRGDFNGPGLPAVLGDFEQRVNFPFAIRIAPEAFLIDPEAKRLSEARYVGHEFERDLEDVQGDERYDMTVTADLGVSRRDPIAKPFGGQQDVNKDERKRITLYEMYYPEHGLIVTAADTGAEGIAIIATEPYKGPDEGPYTIWTLATVPGELIGISPLVALWDQFEELNTHRKHAGESAETHKKIGLYAPSAKADAERVQKAKHGEMIPVQDPAAVKDFELGGTSAEHLNWVEYLRAAYERNLGFTGTQQGLAAGKATATESDIADTASDLRISGQQDRAADCVTDVYRKVCWYFHHDDSIAPVRMPIERPGMSQPTDALMIPGEWTGGYVENTWIDPVEQPDFTDFRLQVDGKSMRKQSDAILQKRAQDRVTVVTQVAPLIATMPYVNWQDLLNDLGASFNDPTFGDRVLNLDLMQQMGMIWPNPVGAAAQPGMMPGMQPMQGQQQAGMAVGQASASVRQQQGQAVGARSVA